MSTTTSMKTKAGALAQLQSMISGLQKHYPNGQFLFGNATYTTVMLVPLFQSLIDAITRVNAAQASAKDIVAAMRGVEANVAPVFQGLKQDLLHTYGTASQTLTDFGLLPRKVPAPRTAEQKAAAAAKAKATRAARGTGSKKSKSTVTGNVVGITVTPITVAPVVATPSAQPATGTSSAPSTGTPTK